MKKMQNNIHKNSIQQKQKGSISNSDDNMYLPPIKYSPQTPHDHSVAVVGPMTMMACPSAPRPTSSRSTSILAATGPSFPCLDAVDTLPIHQRSQAAINQRVDSNIHHKLKIHKMQHSEKMRIPVLSLKPRLSRHTPINGKRSVVVAHSSTSKRSRKSVFVNKSFQTQEKGRSSLHFDDQTGNISVLLSRA